jgi:hypothetical protein
MTLCLQNIKNFRLESVFDGMRKSATTFPAPRLHQVVPNSTGMRAPPSSIPPPRIAVARRARKSEPLVLLLLAAARVPARCASSALPQQNIKISILGAHSSL